MQNTINFRVCTNVRELDVKTLNILSDVNNIYPQLKTLPNGDQKKSKMCMKIHQQLINMQDTCDEKIHLTTLMTEMIESKYKFLSEIKNVEPLADISNVKPDRERVQSPTTSVSQSAVANQAAVPFTSVPQKAALESSAGSSGNNLVSTSYDGKNNERASKRPRRARADTGVDVDVPEVPIKVETQVVKTQQAQAVANPKRAATSGGSKQKKKKKVGKQTSQQSNQGTSREQSVAETFQQEETIDPEEPTYCLCEQVFLINNRFYLNSSKQSLSIFRFPSAVSFSCYFELKKSYA
jgi:hypothetical protein